MATPLIFLQPPPPWSLINERTLTLHTQKMDVAIYPANLFLNDFLQIDQEKRAKNGQFNGSEKNIAESDHNKTDFEISTAIGDQGQQV